MDDPILATYILQAYAAASFRDLVEQQDIFPYWRYKTMGDDRVRGSHAALDGLILPANDPFWLDHFPPWDWGCRCQVITVTREEVEGIKEQEADLPTERRTVIDDPARLQQLRSGHVHRQLPATDPRGVEVGLKQLGEHRYWDVRSPCQAGQPDAYYWKPGTMRVPLKKLEATYATTPKLWQDFLAELKSAQSR